jgi:hypothetical protein
VKSFRAMSVAHALCAAQDGRCFFCDEEFTGPRLTGKKEKRTKGSRGWTRDHLLPAALGGGRGANIVLACHGCNTAKGNTPAVADQIARARAIHASARRMLVIFNGGAPDAWPRNPRAMCGWTPEDHADIKGFYPELLQSQDAAP